MITTWYLQSHRTWDRFCHSCIGSPSCPKGPSRRGSLCRLTRRCTPDRSKLFGSHGQRPWLHDVVTDRLIRVTNDAYINAESVCALLRAVAESAVGLPITLVLNDARYQKCAL